MVEIDNHDNRSKDGDIVETLALFLAGRIKKEELSENQQVIVNYWGPGGIMDEDAKFRAEVYARTEKLIADGEKIPLFTQEQLQKASQQEVPKKRGRFNALPEPFWPDLFSNLKKAEIEPMTVPERNLNRLEKQLDSRFDHHTHTLINEEIKKKVNELRKEIGLPVVRGKDPHVNDRYYKFLVRYIYTYDTFHIFNEYDRELTEIPEGLKFKIKLVTDLVNELLNEGLNGAERKQKYDEFIELHREEWNIVDYRRG